jgi:hypothetical protein
LEKAPIGKVLVGTDAATVEGEPALVAAAALADTQEAELVVVRPGDVHHLVGGSAGDKGHPHFDEELVGHITRRFPGLSARTRRASGAGLGDAVEVAQEERPDVLILLKPFNGKGLELVPAPAVDMGVLTGEDEDTVALAGAGQAQPDDGTAEGQASRFVTIVRTFYSRRVAWAALAVTSLLLTYGGGAVMFWLHARYRGEVGPPINDWYHWFLDSTIGVLTLTPVLFLILPAVLWALGDTRRPRARGRVWCYAALAGLLFTLVTGPGPLVHNVIAGEGTPLANLVTDVFGHDPDVASRNLHAPAHSPLTESLLQLGAGMPVYIGLTWLSIHLVRAMNRKPQDEDNPTAKSGGGALS